MKVWLKLLIAVIIGVLLGIFIPLSDSGKIIFDFLSKLSIQIGRYTIFPLVFFSIVMGTYELRHERKLFAVYSKIVIYLVLSAVLLVLVGIGTAIIFSPERVPIIIETQTSLNELSAQQVFFHIFPKNAFKVFLESGSFLLPLYILAFFIGINLDFNRQITRPAIQVFDSLSRVFYHGNSLIVEFFALGIIAIVTSRIFYVRLYNLEIFKQLLIIIAFDLIIMIFGIFPLLLYFLGGKINPYKWLYATTASAITAVVTGDEYVSLGMLAKHGKENLGLKRRLSSSVYTLFAVFGRAGTALVVSVSFILILRSYSSLELTFMQILWVAGFSIITSFALISVPGMGVYVALSMMSAYYGKGLEEGFLILKPVMPLLVSAGVLLDVVTASLASYLIGRKEGLVDEVDIENFI
ncbi:MAG: dicarboxylate/amino acid:cation symporter [Spirochaetales bacterium]|nr:dicarboxylate/amino acid:cation symporter [Spirochaetales bacterium]